MSAEHIELSFTGGHQASLFVVNVISQWEYNFLTAVSQEVLGHLKANWGVLRGLSGADLGILRDSSTLQVATRASWIVACARNSLCLSAC